MFLKLDSRVQATRILSRIPVIGIGIFDIFKSTFFLHSPITKTQISKSLKEHLQVARAIQDGDEPLAAQAMLLHVPSGSSGFSEFLARMPMSFFESDAADH